MFQLEKCGNQWTSDIETPFSSVKSAIIELVRVMKTDYGRTFESQFKDENSITDFKNRLLTRLRGVDTKAIVNGYNECISRSPKFCPTSNEIVEAIHGAAKDIKRAEIKENEAKLISALPEPTISCDPIQMLAEAKQLNTDKLTHAERKLKREELLSVHNDVLRQYNAHIRHVYASPDHLCAFSGCASPGAISTSTSGGGNFYCAKHWRMI